MFEFECKKHGLVKGRQVGYPLNLHVVCPKCAAEKCSSPIAPEPPPDLLNYTGHITLALNYVNKALEHLIEADRLAPNTRCESLSRTGLERLVRVRDYLWANLLDPYHAGETKEH